MKIKFFRVSLISFALLLVLSSCAKGNKFIVENGEYIDKVTGVEYISTTWEYEPIAVSDEVYGEYTKAYDLTFYKIEGVDPQKYICDNMETLYYANNITLPTLSEMNIDYVNIYNEYDELVTHITDKDFIDKLVDTYVNGYNSYDSMYFDVEPAVEVNQRIKFADTEQGFYYVLAYVDYSSEFSYFNENGKEKSSDKVIFNRYAPKYVAVDGFINEYYAETQE